jgi:transcription initiation factor IIF auxiliary subunit
MRATVVAVGTLDPGTDEDLEKVKSVTYTLHPTFPHPIRTVTDRARNFGLQCAGWGVFTIPVRVLLKTGETIELEHELQFTFPDEAEADE